MGVLTLNPLSYTAYWVDEKQRRHRWWYGCVSKYISGSQRGTVRFQSSWLLTTEGWVFEPVWWEQ